MTDIRELFKKEFINSKNKEKIDLSSKEISYLEKNMLEEFGLDIKELDLANNKFEEIDLSLFNRFDRLMVLNLSYNTIKYVSNEFGRLDNLIELNLSFNLIQSLSKRIFEELPNLKKLYLFNNKLYNVHSDLFKNLTQLEELDLSNNTLQEFHSKTLKNLSNLQSLNLSNNPLEEFDSKILENQSNLQSLNLSFNSLTKLDSNLFNQKDKLEKIILNDNKLTSIDFLFDEVVYIRILNLSNNKLSTIDNNTFDNNSNLTELNLSKNQIKKLDGVVFKRLINLTSVDLSENLIDSIDVKEIQKLKKLSNLNLNGNRLRSFDFSILNSLKNLNILRLNKNLIYNISMDSISNSNLVKLYLNNNKINRIDGTFSGLVKMEEIDLSKNQIDSLPSNIFENLNQLRIVNLRDNKIKSLDQNVFKDQPKIEEIDLGSNQLRYLKLIFNFNDEHNSVYYSEKYDLRINLEHNSRLVYKIESNDTKVIDVVGCDDGEEEKVRKFNQNLNGFNVILFTDGNFLNGKNISAKANFKIEPKTFIDSRHLTKIDLSGNSIKELPKDFFFYLRNLNELYLNNNKLRDCKNFGTALEVIDLSRNNLNHVSVDLRRCYGLKYLNLSHNQLTRVTSNLFCNKNYLQKLILNSNQIKYLEFNSFKDLISLEILDLSGNIIEVLHEDVFRSLNKLRILHLNNNKLSSIDSNIFKRLSNLKQILLNFNNFTSERLELVLEKSVEFISFKIDPLNNDYKDIIQPKINGYFIMESIGNGNFGEVFRAQDDINRKEFAIKKIPTKYCNQIEIELLGKLKSPYIIEYVDHFNIESLICIVTKYYSEGDLANQIKLKREKNQKFKILTIKNWAVELLKGVTYLHNQMVMHRDIKPQNILLEYDSVKLGDFGLSRNLDTSETIELTKNQGTWYYMSPQIRQLQKYSFKTDIWSCGCVIYELITLNYYFNGSEYSDIETNIPDHYNKNFIRNMLKESEDERHDAKDLLLQIEFLTNSNTDITDDTDFYSELMDFL